MQTDKQQDEPTDEPMAEASRLPASSRTGAEAGETTPAAPTDQGTDPVTDPSTDGTSSKISGTRSGQTQAGDTSLASHADVSGDPPGRAGTGASSAASLAPGTRVGAYTIGRLLRDAADNRLYVASREAGADSGSATPDEHEGETPGETRYLLQELPADLPELPERVIAAMIRAGLQHPRLLVPIERIAFEGHDFVVLSGLPASNSQPEVAAEGAALDAVEALRAGAGLADALSYLHRNGFAHLHVAPEVVVLQDERAYLAGLERSASLDEPGREAQALVAQDANDLARTLGMLGHVSATPGNEASEAEQVLGSLAAQGASAAIASPDEVAALCGAGLQANLQPVPPAAPSGDERLRLHYGLATTVGVVRSENQDATAAAIFNIVDDATGAHTPMGVFLVADGMGGEAHGELASRIAARTVSAELMRLYVLPVESYAALSVTEPEIPAPESSSQALAQALNEAVAIANGRIRDMADYFRQDTGTTLTAVAVTGHDAIIAHVGDSRAYLLRDGSLIQLTEDHTLLARLQAMDHPILSDSAFFVPRNFLYRSLGQEQSPPDLLELSLAPGDRLLLCSDGLWDELDDATLQRELATATDPTACAQRLVTLANEAGGHDNSTAVVLFVQTAPQVIAERTERPGAE